METLFGTVVDCTTGVVKACTGQIMGPLCKGYGAEAIGKCIDSMFCAGLLPNCGDVCAQMIGK